MSANSENISETLQFRAGQDLRVGLSGAAVDYLDALLRVLEDQVLTKVERDYVTSIARLHGLSKPERLALHVLFLEQMALELSVEDTSTHSRETQILKLSRQLGLGTEAAAKAMETANEKIEQIVAAWIGDKLSVSELPQTVTSRLLKPVTLLTSLGKGAVKVGSQVGSSLLNVTRLRTAKQDSHCHKCEKVTPHSLQFGKDFPISDWIQLLWKAKTRSIKDYALNAALLAASDKKLLQATGTSLLPRCYCCACKNEASTWTAATIVMGVMNGNQATSNGEQS